MPLTASQSVSEGLGLLHVLHSLHPRPQIESKESLACFPLPSVRSSRRKAWRAFVCPLSPSQTHVTCSPVRSVHGKLLCREQQSPDQGQVEGSHSPAVPRRHQAGGGHGTPSAEGQWDTLGKGAILEGHIERLLQPLRPSMLEGSGTALGSP